MASWLCSTNVNGAADMRNAFGILSTVIFMYDDVLRQTDALWVVFATNHPTRDAKSTCLDIHHPSHLSD